jgi:hypothetical protein|tara:strand:- start:13 stop:234 length:222 start_codon:yes stop_codon:yes gene_type:complete
LPYCSQFLFRNQRKSWFAKKQNPVCLTPEFQRKKTVVPEGHESVAMSPENPRWAKIYVEEMAKRKPEETTQVI